MSAFEKIAGMFPDRELGEKVAREVLTEHTNELVEAASKQMGPEDMVPNEREYVTRYVQGWHGALEFLKKIDAGD